jgi:hypothetical protein
MLKSPTNPYQELIFFIQLCEAKWSAREQVCWEDASTLIQLLTCEPLRSAVKEITDICEWAEENDDWDSGIIANLPTELTALIKADYFIRTHNDGVAVIGLYFGTIEQKVAVVPTEDLANMMMRSLLPVERVGSVQYQVVSSVQAFEARIENGASFDSSLGWLKEELPTLIDGNLIYE